ncbi:MAG: hypothetical protein ACQGVK_15575 [Myxococcota bacterium]
MKNVTGTRYPAMQMVGKCKSRHFRMILDIGTNRRGIVRSMRATCAAKSDKGLPPHLLQYDEIALCGDQTRWKQVDREGLEAKEVRYRVNWGAHGGSRNQSECGRTINPAR